MSKKGAGFLIGKIDKLGNLKFLGLISPIEKRSKGDGIYDLPKGSLQPGESTLECAKRECFEESGIKIEDKDIIGYPVSNKNVTIYPALTTQEAVILPNPDSGIIEHDGYRWVSAQELFKNSPQWLKGVIVKGLSRFSKIQI
jgi:8-oxo-dGTP pyrophosphatase MutT (NUDIX family)